MWRYLLSLRPKSVVWSQRDLPSFWAQPTLPWPDCGPSASQIAHLEPLCSSIALSGPKLLSFLGHSNHMWSVPLLSSYQRLSSFTFTVFSIQLRCHGVITLSPLSTIVMKQSLHASFYCPPTSLYLQGTTRGSACNEAWCSSHIMNPSVSGPLKNIFYSSSYNYSNHSYSLFTWTEVFHMRPCLATIFFTLSLLR